MKGRAAFAIALAATAGCAQLQGRERYTDISGTCDRLVDRNSDATSDCSSVVVIISDGMGGSSLEFFQTRGPMVRFNGRLMPRVGGVRRHRVEGVTVGFPTSHGLIFASSWRATGSCEWTDPFSGSPGHIHCHAHTSAGDFAGSFTSNGEPPRVFR